MSTTPSIDSAREMAGYSSVEQSRRAILHILQRIRNHAHVGYYCGYGTQTFSLLTEAYATLTGETVERVRETFEPKAPKDPVAEARDQVDREKKVRVPNRYLDALDEAQSLLETLSNQDALAAVTGPRGCLCTLDLMRASERKDDLAGKLLSLRLSLEEGS